MKSVIVGLLFVCIVSPVLTAEHYTYRPSGKLKTCMISRSYAADGTTADFFGSSTMLGETVSIYSGYGKRSPSEGQETNTTLADAFANIDKNCDGYVDVTEWTQVGNLTDFMAILEDFDANGDSRYTYEEVKETMNFEVDPNENHYMIMPMEKYKEMKSMIGDMDGDSDGGGDRGSKGRKEK